jgi:hypothetical protein
VVIDPRCPAAEIRPLDHLLEGFAADFQVIDRASRPITTQPSHDTNALVGWLTWQIAPPPTSLPVNPDAAFDR